MEEQGHRLSIGRGRGHRGRSQTRGWGRGRRGRGRGHSHHHHDHGPSGRPDAEASPSINQNDVPGNEAQAESSNGRSVAAPTSGMASKARDAGDGSSIGSSVRSNSRDSLDTSALSDVAPDEAQEATRLVDERGPPPAYTPRTANVDQNIPSSFDDQSRVPAQAERSYGTISPAGPGARPHTPAEIEEGSTTSEANPLIPRSKRSRRRRDQCFRRRWCCCKCSKRLCFHVITTTALVLWFAFVVRHLVLKSSKKVR